MTSLIYDNHTNLQTVQYSVDNTGKLNELIVLDFSTQLLIEVVRPRAFVGQQQT